jgi:beta-1,4-mannosyltransferase
MPRARGYKVIWFAHNATPHDWHGSAEDWFRRSHAFYKNIDAVVHLTTASTLLPVFDRFRRLPQTVVRHPHYDLVTPAVHAGKAGPVKRLLMLGGASQPRKNAYAAAQEIRNIPDVRAVITGDLDSEVAHGIRTFPNVDLIPGILDEGALFDLFDGSTAVLLNQPNQLNSGCMFLGLSRGAPVICPDTPTNREVRSIVGLDWIRLFEAPLSSEKLTELIRDPIPTELPDLSPFSPVLLGKGFRDWVDTDLVLYSGARNRNA